MLNYEIPFCSSSFYLQGAHILTATFKNGINSSSVTQWKSDGAGPLKAWGLMQLSWLDLSKASSVPTRPPPPTTTAIVLWEILESSKGELIVEGCYCSREREATIKIAPLPNQRCFFLSQLHVRIQHNNHHLLSYTVVINPNLFQSIFIDNNLKSSPVLILC